MKEFKTGQLRNVVLLSHQGAGKTTLTEYMALASGTINRPGRVEDGNTIADFEEEEIERSMSLSAGVVALEWKNHKINVLDTPGTFDFVGEVIQSIRVADGALFLVDAVAGVEVGTELTWGRAGDTLPRMVLVAKMDRENASFERAVNSLNAHFEAQFVPMLLPIGSQGDLAGVVDVVRMKAYMGPEAEEADVPAGMADQVDEARMQLIEVAAESDDELIMKYLEGEELSPEEISRGLQSSIASGGVIPVLAASGLSGIGVRAVMDAITAYMPAPPDVITATNMAMQSEEELAGDASAPLSALVFKTTVDPFGKQSYFRVYSGVLESDSRVLNVDTGEEERVGQISVPQGRQQVPIARVIAGDIGVVAKLSETLTGHTLCDQDYPVKLPGIEFPTPIFSVAVSPKTKADSAKMGTGLSRLVEEDPSYEWHLEPSTRQTILSGMGSAHIDIASRRLQRKFGVEVLTAVPKVPYRETITRTAEDTYRHKKQTGGAGQFAQVSMRQRREGARPRARARSDDGDLRQGRPGHHGRGRQALRRQAPQVGPRAPRSAGPPRGYEFAPPRAMLRAWVCSTSPFPTSSRIATPSCSSTASSRSRRASGSSRSTSSPTAARSCRGTSPASRSCPASCRSR